MARSDWQLSETILPLHRTVVSVAVLWAEVSSMGAGLAFAAIVLSLQAIGSQNNVDWICALYRIKHVLQALSHICGNDRRFVFAYDSPAMDAQRRLVVIICLDCGFAQFQFFSGRMNQGRRGQRTRDLYRSCSSGQILLAAHRPSSLESPMANKIRSGFRPQYRRSEIPKGLEIVYEENANEPRKRYSRKASHASPVASFR
jgi:hypothetical protein